MRARAALAIACDLALGVAVSLWATRVADHLPTARLELGPARLLTLAPATRQRLASLRDDVFITFYVSPREQMPSHLRSLESDVTGLLSALAAGSGGRLTWQVVDPTADPDLAAFAARRKVSPLRVRDVRRDSYSEREIWSTLSVAYGPRKPALIEGLGVEHLPRLQSILVEQLDQLEQPGVPVLALAAPPGFSALAGFLGEHGELRAVDLDGGAPLPTDADVLFWIDPGVVTPARLRELEQLLASGKSVVVAGSRLAVGYDDTPGAETLRLRPSGFDADVLLDALGLTTLEGLVLDGRSLPIVRGEGDSLVAPFRIGCIANNQDFHDLAFEPNGNLLFVAPTPLLPDGEALAARGASAEVLATTSEQTWVQPVQAELPLAAMDPVAGEAVPKLPLVVWVRPDDRWRGSVVVLAASTPFRDEVFEAPGVAHPRLARVLVDTLAAPDRLVIGRADVPRAAPLPELPAAERLAWRALCLGGLPLLLGAVVLVRRRPAPPRAAPAREAASAPREAASTEREAASTEREAASSPRHAMPTPREVAPIARGTAPQAAISRAPVGWARPLLAGAGAVGVLLALLAAARGAGLLAGRVDLTDERVNTLHPVTAELAAAARGPGAITAQLIVSGHARLPPALRPHVGRLHEVLDELAAAGAELELTLVHPEDLDAAGLAALEARGIAPLRVVSEDEEVTTVRSVWSSLLLSAAGRQERLDFPAAASFEDLEFRLAFALWRLANGRRPHVAFASDEPRLSAAELHEHYQTQGLISPQGKDEYVLARQLLRDVDLRVTHVDPQDPVVPEDVDLLVWLQPRRSTAPMLAALAEHLYRGGDALLAAQHFNVQRRQYRGTAFRFVHWPRPQNPDLDLYWFPELGIRLVREVLFDAIDFPLDVEGQITRAARRDFATTRSALPIQIRAVSANYDSDSVVTANLGDQPFLWASHLEWDEERLAELGLSARTLITTTEQAWTYAWSGGWIPDELLAGPPVDAAGRPVVRGRLPLAVQFEGRFPWPQRAFERPTVLVGADGVPQDAAEVAAYPEPEPVGEHADGRLLVIGCSEAFKDSRLAELRPAFRPDHLLLNAVVALALEPGLAEVMARRPVSRGFQPPPSEVRLRWRAGVLLATPLAVLLLWALRRVGSVSGSRGRR